jgi:hypothetical protein
MILVGALLVSACAPLTQNARRPDSSVAATVVAPTPVTPAWMAADGAGETALIFGVLGGDTQLVLSCSMTPKTFKVVANGLSGEGWVAGDRAFLIVGTASFEAEARPSGQGGARIIEFSLPLTEGLIAALATAGPVRVNFKGRIQTAPADAQLRELGQTCGLWI